MTRGNQLIPGLQTPLKELVIFHNDPEYHADVKTLQGYVEDELNVHEISYSTDEVACGVQYRAAADWAVLGRRLKKELAKVKRGLESVSSDEMKGYMATSTITISGIDLGAGELTVSRFVERPALGEKFESNTDEDVVVLLDCEIRAELEAEGFARELMNRIQRLRKKAGAVQTDDLDVYYSFELGSKKECEIYFENVLQHQAEVMCRVLRKVPEPDHLRDQSKDVLAEEVQERWGEQKVKLILVRS